MPGLLPCEQRKPSQGEAVGQMAGSGPGPGRQYSGGWPDISPVGAAFLRKAAFLRRHPEWTIDLDRETDAYVAVEVQANTRNIVVERSMAQLMDNLEARYPEAATDVKHEQP